MDVAVERFETIREVRGFRRPVDHLQVDVGVVIRAPRRLHGVGPQPLQVGRHGAGARRTDHEIASELEIQRDERRVPRAVFHRVEALVGRQLRGIGRAEIECGPLEQPLIVGDVRLAQLVGCFGQRRIQFHFRFPLGVAIPPVGQLHAVIGGRREQQRHFGGIGDEQRAGIGLDRSLPGDHRQAAGELHALARPAIPKLAAHQQLIATDRDDLRGLGARQRNAEIQRSLPIRAQADDQRLVRRAGEYFPLEAHAVHFILP